MEAHKKRMVITGLSLLAFHSFVVLVIFLMVQFGGDGQAGFAWFILFVTDFPTAELAYFLLGSTKFMSYLVDWWHQFGHGPNILALILFGFFGGVHWFAIGYFMAFFIHKRRVKFNTNPINRPNQALKRDG